MLGVRWSPVARTVALAAVALALGCRPPALPAVPSRGGPAWTEVTSPHFTIWTDASPKTAHALMRAMEHFRQIVFGVAFPSVTAASKVFVVAFRNDEESHAFLAEQFAAYAFRGDNPLFQPMIVMSAESLDDNPEVLAHELTHVISFNVLPVQPNWFAEGLAQYFETVGLDPDATTGHIGKAPDNAIRALHWEGLLPVAALFACDRKACEDGHFYATAWVLFSYLVNEHPAQLVRYMVRLAELPQAQQAGAWPEVFPDLPPARLDHELARWIHYGKWHVRTFHAQFREWPTSTRALGDADVYAVRGLLRAVSHWKAPLPPEIAQALAIDPTNVVAQLIRAQHDRHVDPAAAHAITAAHPDDWRAWYVAWAGATTIDETRTAHAKLCALLPANPAMLPPELCKATP